MKVKEIMTHHPRFCDLTESVAAAAKTMWDADCGALPVLKAGKELVGLITDRDICMAMAMRDCSPTGVSAEEVISGKVYSVTPEDDVQKALELMQEHKIRRLPVVDSEGDLQGMLSMNDIVLVAEKETGKQARVIPYADVVQTYKAICAHQRPLEEEQGAAAGV